jgi:hypothetical protein
MSFASESTTRAATPGATESTSRQTRPTIRPRTGAAGENDTGSPDWRRLGVFGLGVAVGAVIAAGAALLLAPQSGEETRAAIRRRTRDAMSSAGDSWDDLRAEMAWSARRGRKKLRRGLQRGAWAADDVVDRGRKRAGLR